MRQWSSMKSLKEPYMEQTPARDDLNFSAGMGATPALEEGARDWWRESIDEDRLEHTIQTRMLKRFSSVVQQELAVATSRLMQENSRIFVDMRGQLDRIEAYCERRDDVSGVPRSRVEVSPEHNDTSDAMHGALHDVGRAAMPAPRSSSLDGPMPLNTSIVEAKWPRQTDMPDGRPAVSTNISSQGVAAEVDRLRVVADTIDELMKQVQAFAPATRHGDATLLPAAQPRPPEPLEGQLQDLKEAVGKLEGVVREFLYVATDDEPSHTFPQPKSNSDHDILEELVDERMKPPQQATSSQQRMVEEARSLMQYMTSFDSTLFWGAPDEDAVINQTEPFNLRRRHCLHRFTMAVVILNLIFIGHATDEEAISRQSGTPAGKHLWTVDFVFTLVFTLELCLRMVEYGLCEFLWRGSDKMWNLFDLLLVGSSWIDTILVWSDYQILSVDLSYFRVLRVVRIIRVARIFRSMRFVRDLRVMMAAIINSVFSMFWALVLVSLVVYIWALLIMQSLEANYVRGIDIPQSVNGYYGSVLRSMRTLIEAVSGGNDWASLLAPLEEVHPYYSGLFMFYVILLVFGIMNILTAIFVENASNLLDIDHDLVIQDVLAKDDYTINAIQKLFAVSDRGNRGFINANELQDQLQQRESLAFLRLLGIDVMDVKGLCSLLGLHGDEEVDLHMFVHNMMKLRGTAKEVDAVRIVSDSRKLRLELNGFMRFVQDQFDSIGHRLHLKASPRVSDYIRHHAETAGVVNPRQGRKQVAKVGSMASERTHEG